MPERLLADSAWLRSLARRLVGDPEGAADLQQEVTVAALAQPESAAGGRSWLAAVARNIAVSLRRRRAAEHRGLSALPAREPVPSPAELVATAELQQRAVAAVLALPAVYRDTVLLRFLRGLSLAATAQVMGVPEETVRTRQKRALAALRASLVPESESRGGVAVLGSLPLWGIAMKIKHVAVAVAVAALTLVGVTLWAVGGRGATDTTSPAPAVLRAEVRRPDPAAAVAGEVGGRALVPAPVAVAASVSANLTVRVTWRDDGEPVLGVAVLCRLLQETGTFAITDARGEARFAGLAPGDYQIETPDANSEPVALTAGASVSLERTLARGFAVTGVVRDADGVAVAGAEILTSNGGIGPQWVYPAGRSDDAGRFRLDGMREHRLVGARTTRHGASDFVLLLAGRHDLAVPEPIELRLPGGGCELRGRVVDREGRAVPRAWVRIGADFGGLPGMQHGRDGVVRQQPPAARCTTDAEGRFTIDALRRGEVDVVVYRRGFAQHRERVLLDAAGPRDVLVTLRSGGVLTGTVRDASGAVVVGARVSTDLEYPQVGWQQTGPDGTFRFVDLPAGDLEFEAIAAGFPPQTHTFTFAGAETWQWDVALEAGAAIHGRLVDHQDQPLADWWVNVPGTMRRVRTDAAGRFLIAGCAPADNTLIVRAGGGFVPERTRFAPVPAGEQEQTFVVPAATAPSARLRVQCVTGEGGPLTDVSFGIRQDGWPVVIDTRTGAEGRCDLGPFPPGRYAITPTHKDLAFAPFDLELHANETHDAGVLRGARPARLVVTLQGEAAQLETAKVVLRADGVRIASDGVDAERTFERVFPRGYRIVIRTADGERTVGEITLAPGDDVARTVDLR